MANQIAKIAVENAAYSFDDAFDYAIPPHLVTQVKPGVRVMVPFGRANQKRQGIVFALREKPQNAKLKDVLSVLDETPLLNNEMLRLAVFLKEKTFCTLFEAAKAMFPSGIGLRFVLSYLANPDISVEDAKQALSSEEFSVFQYLSSKGDFQKKDSILKHCGIADTSSVLEDMQKNGYLLHNIEAQKKILDATIKMAKVSSAYLHSNVPIKLTKKQKDVIDFLMENTSASVKEICYYTGVTPAVISTLYKRGYLDLFQNEVYRRPLVCPDISSRNNIILNKEQTIAFEGILEQQKQSAPKPALLFGVTGSGKTQVFLKLIDETLQKNKSVIMMVPEISLTPQMLSIFYNRYGNQVAVFHSALSMGERVDEWKRVQRKEAKIALGTRSAVFAPFENLGLIIMDEEQEHTYKSEMAPKFHTRDVAKFRADNQNALLLLASATPSIESYAKAKQGIYSLFSISSRYGNAVLPEVLTASDASPSSLIGETLFEALMQNLQQKKQSVLLLNRRGYNTFASCSACKTVLTCPNCSISLTYHQRNHRLMCHYCGYSQPYVKDCPTCHAENTMQYMGIGTQRLEDELSDKFPDARILRLDTDTTASKYAFQEDLRKFANHEYDILVGTQMVAKGLDFPKVTLVGVLSIDQLLYNDDYKSAERTFDLLTQVIGRAGRGAEHGKAIIQTNFPDHEVIQLAKQQDFPSFFDLEMKIRRGMIYPPYCDLCAISFTNTDEIITKSAAKAFLEMFKVNQSREYPDMNIIALGPMAPHTAKIAGKYRYRIILKCKANRQFCSFLATQLKGFLSNKNYKKVLVSAEINPESIF